MMIMIIIVVTIVTMLSIRREQQTFWTALEQQADLLLDTLAASTIDLLYHQDTDALTDIMQALGENREILVSGRVYDAEGWIIADAYDENLAYSIESDPFGKKLIESGTTVFEWQPDQLIAGRAVTIGRQLVGAVSVGLPMAPLQVKIASVRKQGISTALVATVIGVLLALLVSRSITSPLQTLVKATTHIAKGDLTQKIELHSHDELAMLGDAMEYMRSELYELYQNLEQQVADRTRELKEKNVQLAGLNASKDKFFSILAQDLQTPITRLLELTQVTEENIEFFSQDELKETAGTLRDSLENLYELLKNLFTWSGIQRGTVTPHPQTVALEEIIRRNMRIFIPFAEEKQVRLKSEITAETSVYTDPDMLYAVVRNLISNALKFTFPGDSINISATQNEDFIEVSVSDTGVGIRQEALPKLFRVDVTYQTPGTAGEEGTGLGLILCKELVERNGGTIWVESEVGEGTTFRFTLPQEP
jgi:signal transduction histidine kinase